MFGMLCFQGTILKPTCSSEYFNLFFTLYVCEPMGPCVCGNFISPSINSNICGFKTHSLCNTMIFTNLDSSCKSLIQSELFVKFSHHGLSKHRSHVPLGAVQQLFDIFHFICF